MIFPSSSQMSGDRVTGVASTARGCRGDCFTSSSISGTATAEGGAIEVVLGGEAVTDWGDVANEEDAVASSERFRTGGRVAAGRP